MRIVFKLLPDEVSAALLEAVNKQLPPIRAGITSRTIRSYDTEVHRDGSVTIEVEITECEL